jgi:DNA mismatch endonuclease (patch repair protein)
MSPETRSAVMSRIRGKDTGPERAVAEALRARGWDFETHARDLPGRPDILFRAAMVAVFVDGDFWHGWRFPVWRDKLSEKWEAKIEANRRRDARNFRRLRRAGWKVVRIWEHQVERDLPACIGRVEELLPRKPRTRSKRDGARNRPGQGVTGR